MHEEPRPQLRNIIRLRVHEGGWPEVTRILQECVTEARVSEPGLLIYEFFQTRDECVGFEVFRDSGALVKHMNGRIVQDLMPRLLEHCDLESVEAFGVPDAEARAVYEAFGASVTDAMIAGLAR